MSTENKVTVASYGPDRALSLCWRDQITGKRKTRSAGTKDWREAERLAGELQRELASGSISPSRILFDDFVNRYDEEKLTTLAPASRKDYKEALLQLKRVLGIENLARLTSSALSTFQAECRKAGMGEVTLMKKMRYIKAAMTWGVKIGLLTKAPAIVIPKRSNGSLAKSRAITTEEYERVLVAIPKARPQDAAQWERFITGLWLSGLRRAEALALSWDADEAFCVCLTERRPIFVIRSEGQKSGRAETCPMAPDFAEFLLATPAAERVGKVFQLIDHRNQEMKLNFVGKVVERIGRAAGVKVGTTKQAKDGTKTTLPVFAGCHSYRRGFGSKWARRVSTAVLKRLMRHVNIATTEAYYIILDAADVSNELWQKFGCQDGSLQQTNNNPPVDSIG